MKQLEDLVPSLETCKELKEAGFEQDTLFMWCISEGANFELGDKGYRLVYIPWEKSYHNCIAAPTLGEIEIPEGHYIIFEFGTWVCQVNQINCEVPTESFDSEIEARAALWLYLNKE